MCQQPAVAPLLADVLLSVPVVSQTEDNVNGAQLGDRLWELTVSFGKIEGKDGTSGLDFAMPWIP